MVKSTKMVYDRNCSLALWSSIAVLAPRIAPEPGEMLTPWSWSFRSKDLFFPGLLKVRQVDEECCHHWNDLGLDVANDVERP